MRGRRRGRRARTRPDYLGFNGYFHHHLLSGRPTAPHLLFAILVLDIVFISVAAALSNGFRHDFIYLFYYPAPAGLAVLFTSFRLNLVWVTMASIVYVAISLTAGDGIDAGVLS